MGRETTERAQQLAWRVLNEREGGGAVGAYAEMFQFAGWDDPFDRRALGWLEGVFDGLPQRPDHKGRIDHVARCIESCRGRRSAEARRERALSHDFSEETSDDRP